MTDINHDGKLDLSEYHRVIRQMKLTEDEMAIDKSFYVLLTITQ